MSVQHCRNGRSCHAKHRLPFIPLPVTVLTMQHKHFRLPLNLKVVIELEIAFTILMMEHLYSSARCMSVQTLALDTHSTRNLGDDCDTLGSTIHPLQVVYHLIVIFFTVVTMRRNYNNLVLIRKLQINSKPTRLA